EEGARVLFESAFAAGSAAEAEFLYPYWFPSQIYRHDAPQHLAPRSKPGPRPLPTTSTRIPRGGSGARRCSRSSGSACTPPSPRSATMPSSASCGSGDDRDAVALPQRLDAGDVFAQSQDRRLGLQAQGQELDIRIRKALGPYRS
ncbi:unnamed protein product, partial [Prorocentrum cordatum]